MCAPAAWRAQKRASYFPETGVTGGSFARAANTLNHRTTALALEKCVLCNVAVRQSIKTLK